MFHGSHEARWSRVDLIYRLQVESQEVGIGHALFHPYMFILAYCSASDEWPILSGTIFRICSDSTWQLQGLDQRDLNKVL